MWVAAGDMEAAAGSPGIVCAHKLVVLLHTAVGRRMVERAAVVGTVLEERNHHRCNNRLRVANILLELYTHLELYRFPEADKVLGLDKSLGQDSLLELDRPHSLGIVTRILTS